MSATKSATLPSVMHDAPAPTLGEASRQLARSPSVAASAGSSTSASTVARSSTISQPTAMRPVGVSSIAALLERAQQHDRAGDREREAEHEPAAERQPQPRRDDRMPSAVADDDLADRARARRCAHRQQVLEREVQADAEHQQDHADLGELGGERVGDEARRERADGDAGEQIADDRRQAEAVARRSRRRSQRRGRSRSSRSGRASAPRRNCRPVRGHTAKGGVRSNEEAARRSERPPCVFRNAVSDQATGVATWPCPRRAPTATRLRAPTASMP